MDVETSKRHQTFCGMLQVVWKILVLKNDGFLKATHDTKSSFQFHKENLKAFSTLSLPYSFSMRRRSRQEKYFHVWQLSCLTYSTKGRRASHRARNNKELSSQSESKKKSLRIGSSNKTSSL